MEEWYKIITPHLMILGFTGEPVTKDKVKVGAEESTVRVSTRYEKSMHHNL